MPKDEITLEDRVNYVTRIVGETLRLKHVGYSNKKVLWNVCRLHFSANDMPAIADMIDKQSNTKEVVCDVSPLPRPLPLPS